MIEGDLDDSPEYLRAREEFAAYWKRIHNGLESGVDDDPTISIARLVKQFGFYRINDAFHEYAWNMGFNFDLRWQEIRKERIRQEKETQQKERNNPNGAGRRRKRSDVVLISVWLIVQRTMRLQRTTAVQACKLLVKAKSRREATRWPGLLLCRDPHAGPYYVKTPANLRDIYNDAVKYYSTGSERLKRFWEGNLEVFLGMGGGDV